MKRSPRTTMMTMGRRTYVCVKCGHVGESKGHVRDGDVSVNCEKCDHLINLGRAPGAPAVKG